MGSHFRPCITLQQAFLRGQGSFISNHDMPLRLPVPAGSGWDVNHLSRPDTNILAKRSFSPAICPFSNAKREEREEKNEASPLLHLKSLSTRLKATVCVIRSLMFTVFVQRQADVHGASSQSHNISFRDIILTFNLGRISHVLCSAWLSLG